MEHKILEIEIYTGLTLNYSFQSFEYRDYYYPILRKLLFLNKRQQLPVSAKTIQTSIKDRVIPLKVVEEVLNELYFFSILGKSYYPDGNNEYDFW